MRLFLLFLISFTVTVFAGEITYTDAEFKASPVDHARRMDAFFQDEGYVPLADPSHGIPSLGINQVYIKDEGQFIMVKYGITGEFALNEWIDMQEEGHLVHQKTGDNKYFLQFRGINLHAAKLLVHRMESKLTSYVLPSLRSVLIQEAHADDCPTVGAATVAQMADFNNLTASMVWNFARSCATGLGQGAWNSTGGAVASGISSLWTAVTRPVETIRNVSNSVYNFTVGLGRFVRGIVTNPRATMAQAGARVGGAWNQMVDVVSGMSTDLKIQFICNLLGSLGVDAAIVFFTAGAGSVRLAATLGAMARRFAMIGRVWGVISRMSVAGRAALGFSADKLKRLMERLMAGDIPEDDLRLFEDTIQADRNLGLRAFACTI